MKRIGFWIGTSIILYFCTGVLFPIKLYNEFGIGSFGEDKLYAGLVNYAMWYPHIVLYPLCWSIFAFVNLGLALSAIDGYSSKMHNSYLWRLTLVIPLIFFAVFALYIAHRDARNPCMMLFEISPVGQQKLIGEYIEDEHIQIPNTTVVGIVYSGIKESGKDQKSQIRNRLFDWKKTWKTNKKYLSKSRFYYLITVAGIVWAMLSVLLCATFAAIIPQKFIARRRALCASIGAATGLLLWFPHRIYYNSEIKNKLFDLSINDNPFNFWIPDSLKEHGLTNTESLPIFFVIIFFFITIVIVLKKDPQSFIKKCMEWMGIVGVSAATIWSAIEPKNFGRAIGIIDGNWDNLITITLVLFVLFILYGVFILHQLGETPTDDMIR